VIHIAALILYLDWSCIGVGAHLGLGFALVGVFTLHWTSRIVLAVQ
jgi:hypothetical protein